ncbi:MAG: hypothetical protein N4A74_15830 [Carboxylicivirga sp.]|nr:hypothetical protein [Carboxylicivirga sp.]
MKHNHLTDEQIAICAEALNADRISSLPENICVHLDECEECSHQVLAVSETILELSDSPLIELKKTHHNSLKKIIGIAATMAIVLSIGVYLFKIPTQESELSSNSIIEKTSTIVQSPYEKPDTLHTIQTKTPENNQLLTSKEKQMLAFTPHMELDKLSERFDASAQRGDEVKVLSQVIGRSSVNQIDILWENPDKQSLLIEIYDNRGIKINEIETNNPRACVIKLTNKGLYYWKLLNEDYDLLFCGKIWFE